MALKKKDIYKESYAKSLSKTSGYNGQWASADIYKVFKNADFISTKQMDLLLSIFLQIGTQGNQDVWMSKKLGGKNGDILFNPYVSNIQIYIAPGDNLNIQNIPIIGTSTNPKAELYFPKIFIPLNRKTATIHNTGLEGEVQLSFSHIYMEDGERKKLNIFTNEDFDLENKRILDNKYYSIPPGEKCVVDFILAFQEEEKLEYFTEDEFRNKVKYGIKHAEGNLFETGDIPEE